jgi:hypothetical protein
MSLFRDCRTAVKLLWTTHWPGAYSAVPVYWHEGVENIVPHDPADTPRWLHLAVEFDAEGIRAFGGGPGANDRALFGSVVIRVFTARGGGEDTALDYLSDALACFAGRRSADGKLSCIGANAFPAPLAAMDGTWWQRSALASFEYRYQG